MIKDYELARYVATAIAQLKEYDTQLHGLFSHNGSARGQAFETLLRRAIAYQNVVLPRNKLGKDIQIGDWGFEVKTTGSSRIRTNVSSIIGDKDQSGLYLLVMFKYGTCDVKRILYGTIPQSAWALPKNGKTQIAVLMNTDSLGYLEVY
jgi:hypothetical protein